MKNIRRPLFAAIVAASIPGLALADGCQKLLTQLVSNELRSFAPAQPAPPTSWLEQMIGDDERPAPRRQSARDSAAEAPSADVTKSMASGAAASAPMAEAKAGKKDGASGPRSVSRTNTQEAAVDEGDIVKTDGRYVYHVSCSAAGEASGCRDELRIYASWPPSASKLLARVRLGGGAAGQVKQIYLGGDKVVALLDGSSAPRKPHLDGRVSRMIALDVSDPRAPRKIHEQTVEGAFVDARMIGSRLYVATRTPAPRLTPEQHSEVRARITAAASAGVAPTAEDIVRRLDHSALDLPHTAPVGGPARPAYRCADLAVTDGVHGDGLLNLVHFDLRLGGDPTGAGVAGHSAQSVVYASEGAFYVADPIAPVAGRGWQSATTVRKFDLSQGGHPRFEAAGTVRGTPINQFALSEHDGHLRIATSDQWASNNVYVLRASGVALTTVGAIEGLAPNERIFSARMMGARGYLVTFRRTDPLYTLDLSDPTRPRVVGELKIEGWSSYLHPLGNNHLLAVGQDADQWGRPTGFHLQVFDVTDPKSPTRKFHHKLDGGSVSGSERDHHAFMFEPETQTLAVPYQSESYWGLLAYRVDPRAGFVELGRVNHALMYKQFFQKQCARDPMPECRAKNHWYGYVTRPAISVDRIVAIDDQLYSVSPTGMMVHRTGDKLSLTTSVLVSAPAWRSAPQLSRAEW